MKKTVIMCSLVIMLSAFVGSALAGTEGNTNTFYGTVAGRITAGDTQYDTFIGSRAGYFNTTGYRNTFIGYGAGYSNTTGYGNQIVGYGAGNKNTTGFSNTFFGYVAGYANTVGVCNTFMGDDAGHDNTTGSNNTFVGSDVGLSNTTGHDNIFMGYETGYFNTTGYGNNFSGVGAGMNNTTGYNNTFFGNQAGHTNTTGSGNVFIGYNAGGSETGSNKLYIGNSAAPLIYGDFSAQTVNITGTLTVNGAIVQTSSREYKDDIIVLSRQEAFDTLAGLNPVKYVYKANRNEQHVGFIAEDVPDLVATKDRKGLSSMDIVSVLTKVVQEQQGLIKEQQKIISAHSEKIAELERMLIPKEY